MKFCKGFYKILISSILLIVFFFTIAQTYNTSLSVNSHRQAVIPSGKINSQTQYAYDLIKTMLVRTKQINTLKFTLKTHERFQTTMFKQKAYYKLIYEPFKVYYKQEYPVKGLEVLYVSGSNNNKALVNTNSFPWINISLNPYGNLIRENQHHTIFESGFDYMVSILKHLLNKYDTNALSMIESYELVNLNGQICHKIILENQYFKYFSYTVKKGETINTIAKKFKINDYMIIEKNNNIDDFNDNINPGQVIKIPNDYAKKIIIYIEKQRIIPVVMKIYDDKGLYEYYEFSNIKINPEIKPGEFSREYAEYGF